ncbi:glycosyltransferase family 39 protein [Rapidithrix thailandica]|uniref:Glycosyltransferase family 39 protein n=1 Tax=Rapidithrix thailandica TaxID=413964 RepID=A0AAW9S805_9BACT
MSTPIQIYTQTLWEKQSFKTILWIAFLVRLLAAFFSKGYAFHDDHFCVITVAQNWVYHLPHWFETGAPPLHSMFYAGFHYLLFLGLEQIGITNPEVKMTLVRLIHAAYSVLIVYYGYKITELLSDKKSASIVGLVLSLIWFMPYLSVKNLVEMTCIPPYLAGFYLILKANKKNTLQWQTWLAAGALFGFAFVLRYHTILFAGGLGLVLLFRKQWLESLLFSIGYLLVATLIQGGIDWAFFDYPFHSIVEYFEYNSAHANAYVSAPAYRFVLTVVGFLVPPVSIFLVYGFIRGWKIEPMMFMAAIVFFVFHSIVPNKQERFILPLLPIIIILGTCGWQEFVQRSKFWLTRQGFIKGCWIFFWVLNIGVAIALSVTYSKKGRIEPLRYLAQKEDLKAFILESYREFKFIPVFYLGTPSGQYEEINNRIFNNKNFDYPKPKYIQENVVGYTLWKDKKIDKLQQEIADMQALPNYIIFTGREGLEERIAMIEKALSASLALETQLEPGAYDAVLHFLNPGVHPDEHTFIYKISYTNK